MYLFAEINFVSWISEWKDLFQSLGQLAQCEPVCRQLILCRGFISWLHLEWNNFRSVGTLAKTSAEHVMSAQLCIHLHGVGDGSGGVGHARLSHDALRLNADGALHKLSTSRQPCGHVLWQPGRSLLLFARTPPLRSFHRSKDHRGSVNPVFGFLKTGWVSESQKIAFGTGSPNGVPRKCLVVATLLKAFWSFQTCLKSNLVAWNRNSNGNQLDSAEQPIPPALFHL